MSTTFETTPEQFAALAARPADAQVVMVNLLKFNTAGWPGALPAIRANWSPRTWSASARQSAMAAPPRRSSSVTASARGGTRS